MQHAVVSRAWKFDTENSPVIIAIPGSHRSKQFFGIFIRKTARNLLALGCAPVNRLVRAMYSADDVRSSARMPTKSGNAFAAAAKLIWRESDLFIRARMGLALACALASAALLGLSPLLLKLLVDRFATQSCTGDRCGEPVAAGRLCRESGGKPDLGRTPLVQPRCRRTAAGAQDQHPSVRPSACAALARTARAAERVDGAGPGQRRDGPAHPAFPSQHHADSGGDRIHHHRAGLGPVRPRRLSAGLCRVDGAVPAGLPHQRARHHRPFARGQLGPGGIERGVARPAQQRRDAQELQRRTVCASQVRQPPGPDRE